MLVPILFLLFLPAGGDASVLLQKGLVELQNGQVTQAREDLRAASLSDPHNGYVWSALAEVYLRNHEPDLAESAALAAAEPAVSDPVLSHALALYYSHAGNWALAAAAERRFAASPRADPAANARLAQWYLAARDVPSALPFALKAAAAGQPAAFQLAQFLLREQRFTEAAQVLEAGLATSARDPQLTLALGVARYGQRRFEDAIQLFLDVIRIDPGIEQPYLFLGKMLDQAGAHLDEIISRTQAWSAQHPENGQAQLLLAKALLARNPEEPQAGTLLRRAAELEPESWEAQYQLGLLLETWHQYEAAAAQFRKALQLDPNQPNPHYHLARVYTRLGKSDLAAAELAIHKTLTSGPAAGPR